MQPYTLKILPEDPANNTGNGLKVRVNSNAEEKPLAIIVTIRSSRSKVNLQNGFRASVEFFEADNRIYDMKSIAKEKKFWELIDYYLKEIMSLPSAESLLLGDNSAAQERKSSVEIDTLFDTSVAPGNISKVNFDTKRKFTADFVFALESIFQGFNVYTSCKGYDDSDVSLARTDINLRAGTITYIDSTLYCSKLATPLVYLHLGNLILVTQLILKQAIDLSTRIQKSISYVKKRAIPYSAMIGAAHFLSAAYFSQDLPVLVPSLIWPIIGLCIRIIAPHIISISLKFAIGRYLRS